MDREELERSWSKLKAEPTDSLLILSDNGQGRIWLEQARKAGLATIVYIDNDAERCRKTAQALSLAYFGGEESMEALASEASHGYGLTKAIVAQDKLDSVDKVIGVLAKGSTLMLDSADPNPPDLDLSTTRLHYDQLTICSA
jgi:D-arabinose 1-dehydrogenase-like Zn-dependent alcohol dehydrogenase